MPRTRPSSKSVVLLFALAAAAVPSSVVVGCSENETSDEPDGGPPAFAIDARDEHHVCRNLECDIDLCLDAPKTVIQGVVYDPSGRLPLHNAVVYVPNDPPGPLSAGVSCDRCDEPHSGAPLRITTTNALGRYRLEDVPSGVYVPLVVQLGKWRREFRLRQVNSCETTSADLRLPRSRAEGNIPRLAVVTGAADPLQCLLRKIGIDDDEVGVPGTEARVHLYRGGGYEEAGTTRAASDRFTNGVTFPPADALLTSTTALAPYDAVLLACEGAANATAPYKTDAAKQALWDYAKLGGRVFAAHHHRDFFSASPDPAPKNVAQWNEGPPPTPDGGDPRTVPVALDVSATFPKGKAFDAWLEAQSALTDGRLQILDARHDVEAVNAGAVAWLDTANPHLSGKRSIQHLTFAAPVGASCGRVAFSEVHFAPVPEGAAEDDPSKPYPEGCQTTELTAQQKALAFLLFDLWSCAQKDDDTIVAPR